MSTDRELLELAAKAAGWKWYPKGTMDDLVGGWLDPSTGYMHWEDIWNPLTDDGDALRLAVKLKLSVLVGVAQDGEGRITVDKRANPYAATRRAIVRAAAEIGRNMK